MTGNDPQRILLARAGGAAVATSIIAVAVTATFQEMQEPTHPVIASIQSVLVVPPPEESRTASPVRLPPPPEPELTTTEVPAPNEEAPITGPAANGEGPAVYGCDRPREPGPRAALGCYQPEAGRILGPMTEADFRELEILMEYHERHGRQNGPTPE
ncbi:MAG: hypothetical protein AB7G06_02975 [Bdellovibrionales bacterium]